MGWTSRALKSFSFSKGIFFSTLWLLEHNSSLPSVSLLPCRSDGGARTCRLPLTRNPPAPCSCFSWTYLRLSLKPAVLVFGEISWLKKKKRSDKVLPPRKSLFPLCPVSSRRRTVPGRVRLFVVISRRLLLETAYSFTGVPGAGRSSLSFLPVFFLLFLMTRTLFRCVNVWRLFGLVRINAGSTTWTHDASLLPYPPCSRCGLVAMAGGGRRSQGSSLEKCTRGAPLSNILRRNCINTVDGGKRTKQVKHQFTETTQKSGFTLYHCTA